PPNSWDARSSVRTNEHPNRMRSLTYGAKPTIDNLSLVLRLRTLERASLRACGMTCARPAQGTATTPGDGLVRGRHKARPLQLTMVWCEAGTRRGHYN
ncbi:MAG: hypothetical protein PUG75_11220, partial [Prevotella sp.]|nr:hypothetical protein [Prevotella sp.]